MSNPLPPSSSSSSTSHPSITPPAHEKAEDGPRQYGGSTAEVEEPVFEELEEDITQDMSFIQEDALIRDALSQGIDLRKYSRDIETELHEVEATAVDDYVEQAPTLSELQDHIHACDDVLKSMESILLKFQGDLGSISTEIRSIQERSFDMNVKLVNRQKVDERLRSFVDDLAVPETLVTDICDKEVDEKYLEHLLVLDAKSDFVRMEKNASAKACQDVTPEINKLIKKACGKLREFLLEKILMLRKPRTNVQMQQQPLLLKFKLFNEFLMKHDRDGSYAEVRDSYVETVSKIYYSHFKAYAHALQKQVFEVGGRGEFVGSKDPSPSSTALRDHHGGTAHAMVKARDQSGGSSSSLSDASGPSASVSGRRDAPFMRTSSTSRMALSFTTFSIGDRVRVLTESTAASAPHVLKSEGRKIPFEELFRSLHVMLADTVTSECLFDMEFFGRTVLRDVEYDEQNDGNDDDSSTSRGERELREIVYDKDEPWDEIFGKTLLYVTSVTEAFLFSTHDIVGINLVIRLTEQIRQLMRTRGLSILDAHLDKLKMLLWPKFKHLFTQNVESVEKIVDSIVVTSQNTQPHFITRRFAELSSSVLTLLDEEDSGNVTMNLRQLRMAMENFLLKVSSQMGSMKNQIVFLINNYDLILRIHQDMKVRIEGTRDLLLNQIAAFVEEELSDHFSRLITLVKFGESNPSEFKLRTEDLNVIVSDFSREWKSRIEVIHGDVVKSFSNFRNGMEILKQILTQMLLYYNRLVSLVEKHHPTAPFRRSLVPNQVILYEIKKYSKDFQ